MHKRIVSKNDYRPTVQSHCAGTVQSQGRGKKCNRWVLSRDRKTATEGVEVTGSGRLFQTRAAATGKARSPTAGSRVRTTISDEEELERSCWRASTSATWQSSLVRYAGADLCRHLYMRTACLNAIRSGAFSQCSWQRSGVMCWNFDEEKITLTQHHLTLT